VISYDDNKVNELLSNKDIIRNKRKISASINNSKIFKTIVDEYGSFYNYLRTFTKDRTIYETNKTTNDLSDALSKDLQNRGMTFVGSVIIYAYLQAIGVIYSHDKDCYLYKSGE
jgi:DNA-3-methyladenine glycosylase I